MSEPVENVDREEDGAHHKFATVCYVFTDTPADQYIERLKSIYDHVEVYDANKEYPKGTFQAEYTGRSLPYTYELHQLNGSSIVVAKQRYTKEQIEALAPYCQCAYHQCRWYNPTRFFICRCCHGCLDAGEDYASTGNVKRALEQLRKRLEPLNPLL